MIHWILVKLYCLGLVSDKIAKPDCWKTRVVKHSPDGRYYMSQFKIHKRGKWENFLDPLTYAENPKHDKYCQPFLGNFDECVEHCKRFKYYTVYKIFRDKQKENYLKKHSAKVAAWEDKYPETTWYSE